MFLSRKKGGGGGGGLPCSHQSTRIDSSTASPRLAPLPKFGPGTTYQNAWLTSNQSLSKNSNFGEALSPHLTPHSRTRPPATFSLCTPGRRLESGLLFGWVYCYLFYLPSIPATGLLQQIRCNKKKQMLIAQ